MKFSQILGAVIFPDRWTVDIVESEPENDHGAGTINQNNSIIRVPREKMVYMTVNDSQQEDEDLSK